MMRGETFEQMQQRSAKQQEAGEALAKSRWARGQRLTETERQALTHWSRWGLEGYPIRKLRSGWTIDHPAAPGFPLMRTKREAVGRWETLIACWIDLSGFEAQERTLAERASVSA